MNDHLKWRYATKKFDPTRKVPADELKELLDVLRLAPSSFGLQPWRFVHVKNPSLRAKLQDHAWNQPQITEASDLIVLCALKTMDEAYVRAFVDRIAHHRHVARETLAGYEGMMTGFVKSLSPEAKTQWMKKQVYIALGFLLDECAHHRIDACPMEGFDAPTFNQILELDKLGLESVVLCPIGYRASDDPYISLAKVRFDLKDVVIEK